MRFDHGSARDDRYVLALQRLHARRNTDQAIQFAHPVDKALREHRLVVA